MADAHRKYELRCPVHGFIPINDWEREIINQPAFQRLRRIRQLAWTDYVYPGAMHTRFEHSLGVMHVATQLFDAIVERSGDLLVEKLNYDKEGSGFRRDRVLVRLAALLHDVGHAPFSHAGEDVFPFRANSTKRFKHEAYSSAIIRQLLNRTIEDHPLNQNHDIKADNIASLIEGTSASARSIFWRFLIAGQMDADRMDYLLRDSLHAGVDYGKYDLRRLLNTVVAIEKPQPVDSDDSQGLVIGVTDGGMQAAESLILARYFMFTQVYFHKTRVAFDHHFKRALPELIKSVDPSGTFPTLDTGDGTNADQQRITNLNNYIKWDDWRVLGMFADGKGGDHGRRLVNRDHFRLVHSTPECPTPSDLARLNAIENALKEFNVEKESAGKSWYKVDKNDDVDVLIESDNNKVQALSIISPVIKGLKETSRVMLYTDQKLAATARNIANSC